MKIHKEGYKMIPLAALALWLLYSLLSWLIPFGIVDSLLFWAEWGVFFLVVWFFRDPMVKIPQNDKEIIAPAEGKIVVIEKVFEDEWLKKECIQISIFMSPLNVHVNRSPMQGKIAYYKYHLGKYLVAWHPKSSTKNERTSIGIVDDRGTSILMRQIAGAVARRIAFYPSEKERIAKGQSIGFIRFGSRVDLFLPLTAKVKVKINDKTKCGKTPIATF